MANKMALLNKNEIDSNPKAVFGVITEMRGTNYFGLFGLMIILFGCLESDLGTTDKITSNDIDYLDNGDISSEYPNDPFRIIGVIPKDGNIWDVVIQHGGGCEEHFFFTQWDEQWTENSTSFVLLHDSNNDLCKALIRDTLILDLSRVIAIPSGVERPYISIINASNDRHVTVDPDLADLSLGEPCGMDVTIVGTSCGQGIWNNHWLQLKEEVPNHESVWLQPVINGNTVLLNIPESGEYRVGVTTIFGYEYDSEASRCPELPEGTVVTAQVDCLIKL